MTNLTACLWFLGAGMWFAGALSTHHSPYMNIAMGGMYLAVGATNLNVRR